MNVLWSLSQSPAAKDICVHLSDKKRRTAMLLAGMLGMQETRGVQVVKYELDDITEN